MAAGGKLRDRILLQQRTADGYGDPAGPWPPIDGGTAMRADVVPLRGGESVMGQRLQGKQPVIISVRRCALTLSIDNAWRAVNARTGAIYDIASVAPAEDLGLVDILAVSGGADG